MIMEDEGGAWIQKCTGAVETALVAATETIRKTLAQEDEEEKELAAGVKDLCLG